ADPEVPARERGVPLGPQRLHETQGLVHPDAALVERLAEQRELLGHPADPDTEDHPPARETVGRGDLLGRDDRMPHRQDGDAGADPDRASAGGKVAAREYGYFERSVRGTTM